MIIGTFFLDEDRHVNKTGHPNWNGKCSVAMEDPMAMGNDYRNIHKAFLTYIWPKSGGFLIMVLGIFISVRLSESVGRVKNELKIFRCDLTGFNVVLRSLLMTAKFTQVLSCKNSHFIVRSFYTNICTILT